MSKRWVIGDVHGCAKTLKELTEEKLQITTDDEIFMLGDYIDRGPDSKGVIDYLMGLNLRGYKIRGLLGNHEDMMMQTLQNKGMQSNWFYNGGLSTLNSFRAKDVKAIPEQYFSFMESLEYYISLDDFILVHAGFNFELDDPFEDKEAMLWIRNEEVQPEKIDRKKMIHGHTPLDLDQIKASLEDEDNYDIDLDNGCVYHGIEGLGNLVALELNSMDLVVQQNIDIF